MEMRAWFVNATFLLRGNVTHEVSDIRESFCTWKLYAHFPPLYLIYRVKCFHLICTCQMSHWTWLNFYRVMLFMLWESKSIGGLFRIPQNKNKKNPPWNFLRRYNVVSKSFNLTSILLRPTFQTLSSSTPPLPLFPVSTRISFYSQSPMLAFTTWFLCVSLWDWASFLFSLEDGYSVVLPEKLDNGKWNVYR